MTGPQIRAFIEDGPRGGEWATIGAAPDGTPPPRLDLLDPAVAEIASTGVPLPPAQRHTSTYQLAPERQADDGAVYRFVGPAQ
ncbi:MAG: hypothetical protein L0I76_08180 [Pseudonocardia sp.]|nr:hypothetical protein [Pseudonocardia sp.]